MCDPEHSARGNIQLGVSLLWSLTDGCRLPAIPLVDSLLLPTNPTAGPAPNVSRATLGLPPVPTPAAAGAGGKKTAGGAAGAKKGGAAAAAAAVAPVAVEAAAAAPTGPETDIVPASSILPISPANLYPATSDVARMKLPNPLLGKGESSGKISIPAPVHPFPADAQKRLNAVLTAPMGMAMLERCVHIARFNSILAHGSLPFFVPARAADIAAAASAAVAPSAPLATVRRSRLEKAATTPEAEAEGKMAVSVVSVDTPPTLVLFPAMALLNHSCAPNAAPRFGHVPTPARLGKLKTALKGKGEGESVAATEQDAAAVLGEETTSFMAVVTAARDIVPGEEVTFNYVPLVSTDGPSYLPWMPIYRRAATKEAHAFPCACPRCVIESGPAIGSQLTSKYDNTRFPLVRSDLYTPWATSRIAAADAVKAELRAAVEGGSTEATFAASHGLTTPIAVPPATADGFATAQHRLTALKALLLHGCYNKNSADVSTDGEAPSIGNVLLSLGLVDKDALARAKAVIEREESSPEAVRVRWTDDKGAVAMRAAGLYVHNYTTGATTSTGLCLESYKAITEDPYMSLLLPYLPKGAGAAAARAAATKAAGPDGPDAATLAALDAIPDVGVVELEDVAASLTAACAEAWRVSVQGPAKKSAAALPAPAPLAVAGASTKGTVRAFPFIVPSTVANGEMCEAFGIRRTTHVAAPNTLAPTAPTEEVAAAVTAAAAAAATAEDAEGKTEDPTPLTAPLPTVYSSIAGAALAVPVDSKAGPGSEVHTERNPRLAFALHAYKKCREVLIAMPDDDELASLVAHEDEAARLRAAEGGALITAGIGRTAEEIAEDAVAALDAAETDVAVANTVDEVRRGRAYTEAKMQRDDHCRDVVVLLERAMVQVAQVAAPTHWMFYLLHSARAVALERLNRHAAALPSRVAVLVIAALSLPERHQSIGELASATVNACAECVQAFAADKQRLDFHATQAAEAAGDAAAVEKLELSAEDCEEAREVMRLAAARVDMLLAYLAHVQPLCSNGVPAFQLKGTKKIAL